MSDLWWMDARDWSCWIEQTDFYSGYGIDGGGVDYSKLTAQGNLNINPTSAETTSLNGSIEGHGRKSSDRIVHYRGVNYLNPSEEQIEVVQERYGGPLEVDVTVNIGKIVAKERRFEVGIASRGYMPGTKLTTMDGIVTAVEDCIGDLHVWSIKEKFLLPRNPAQLTVSYPHPGFPGRKLRLAISPSKAAEAPGELLPPGQRRMSADEQALWQRRFPKMNVREVIVAGKRDWRFNCMAHTLDIRAKHVWPGPNPGSPTTMERLLDEYRAQGWEERPDGEVIAIYSDPQGHVYHVSKVLPDGRHDSKLGGDLRLIHRPEDLEGGKMYPNVTAVRYICGRKPDAPVPTPAPAPKQVVQLQRARATALAGGHRIVLDGKRVDGNMAVLLAERMPPGDSRKLSRELLATIKKAEQEAEFRRGMWANFLTRPARANEYPVHYTIEVDSVEGNVGYPSWHSCKNKHCFENRRWPD